MRTAGIAFAAGLGGVLSGGLIAAAVGAADPNEGGNDAAAPPDVAAAAEAGGTGTAGKPDPRLVIKETALIEGPLTELTYGAGASAESIEGGEDSFAWVYPEWVVAGSLAGDEVVVLPREAVVRLRMSDVTDGPRQSYREQATELRRLEAEENRDAGPAEARPDAAPDDGDRPEAPGTERERP